MDRANHRTRGAARLGACFLLALAAWLVIRAARAEALAQSAERAAKIERWRAVHSPGKPVSAPAEALPEGESAGPRGGGDTCENPLTIGGLPFSDAGNACLYAHQYDETCPFFAPGSPDVVYAYTATYDTLMDVSLCGNTVYDSKLYVYQNACGPTGSFIACNDDDCSTPSFPNPYVSRVLDVAVTAGNTYYIIVDGYSGACGPYTLDVTADPPTTGACCDTAAGICSNGVAPEDCVSPLDFTPGMDCANLEPPCGVGACCDTSTGVCSNGVAMLDCPSGATFVLGGACDDIVPPCGLGACCVGGSCSVQTAEDCGVLAGFFQGAGVDCGEADCAGISTNGVCCLAAGGCQPGTPDGCMLSGGEFHGNGATCADADSNGTADVCESDCNTNGVLDALDVARGNSVDCNFNGRPDECDLTLGVSRDCNTNGLPDDCEPKDWAGDAGCVSGIGGGLAFECECFDADADADGDLRDWARYQADYRAFPSVFVSNGTGGGDWFDPATWDVSAVPASARHYDVVRILPGDTVTQSAATPYTMALFLLEAGAVHHATELADVAALVVESYGLMTNTNGFNPGEVTVRNAAEVVSAGDAEISRVYDADYCDILDAAPSPFDELGPCAPRRDVPQEEPEDPHVRFDNRNTHQALTDVAMDNNLCKVHDFLTKDLLIKPGIDQTATDGGTRSFKDWAVLGSDLEDSPLQNVRNHFHNPINNAGLFSWTNNAPTWAFDGSVLGGPNDWDFVSGRGYYFDALTQAQPAVRSQFFARTFRAVGQIMHLIEDMGSVAHTRNDKHPIDAPFEAYCAANFGMVAQLNALAAVTTGAAGTPPRHALTSPLPGFTNFMDWWDTGQWFGQAGFGGFGATPGLAEFSNFNFFSEDTVFWFPDMPRPNVADTDLTALFPPPANGQVYEPSNEANTAAGWVYVAKTTPTALTRLARARNIGVARWRSGLSWFVSAPRRIEVSTVNNNCYRQHVEHILPRCIAYCTDFANYFFRGKLDIRLRWNEAQQKYFLTITNKSGEALGAGTWGLYQDDASDVRAQIAADFSGYAGALANNASFDASFQATARRGRYTLVFQGTMGNEANTAIAAKVFDIVRVHITWDPKSDQDLYMRGPDGSLIAYFNLATQFGELDNDNIGGTGPENITLKNLATEGDYQFMINYYRDWWRERSYDSQTESCVDNTPPLNSPDDEGTNCYTETTITITVKTYHNSSDPVREMTRTLSHPNYGDAVPFAGTPEGAVGNEWFVTQIVTVDQDGEITVEGGN